MISCFVATPAARRMAFALALLALARPALAQSAPTTVAASPLAAEIDTLAAAVEPELIAWRRHLHQHPELSNREVETAKFVAERLRSFGLEPQTGVAKTGVVALLKGGRPGPVVALRADMDGLPVKEEVNLPFASQAVGEFEGNKVGVMHACGHDTHVAILMATASVLAAQRENLAGTIIFVFQPSEEGAPPGGLGGARRMLQENLFGDLRPQAMYGLHAWPGDSGTITMLAGPAMAGSDRLDIRVTGSQTHGAQPHAGIDPIVVSSQIINALQTIPSRQMDAVRSPVIVTVGSIHGGVRYNIIPQTVEMQGTIRYLNPQTREDLYNRIRRTVTEIAAASGAAAEVTITENAIPVVNPADLTARARASTARALGADNVLTGLPVMPAEDFAYFQQAVPAVFFFYGVNPPGVSAAEAAPNHNPRFFVHEPAMETALRAMVAVALDGSEGAN